MSIFFKRSEMMTRAKKHLTKAQIGKLRDKLLSSKEEILNKNQQFHLYYLDQNELIDHVDEASENTQKSEELRFRNRNIFYLKKINKALKKIERAEYGYCYECDGFIGFSRLWARPVADMCIDCKEESEKDEKGNFFGRQSKSKGMAIHEMSF